MPDSTQLAQAVRPTEAMPEGGAVLWMEIDLDAVAENFRLICRLADGRRVLAMVKADAYGHGAVPVARRLAACGAVMLASGSLEEAIILRRAGLALPILVLGPVLPGRGADFTRHHLVASVQDTDDAVRLAGTLERPAPVWVKVDCGFGRFGVPLPQAAALVDDLTDRHRVAVQGIYTHLPFSDPTGRDWAQRQSAAFDAMVDELARRGRRPDWVQCIASPALFHGLAAHGDVAVGGSLYGLTAAGPDGRGAAARPALRGVRTRLIRRGERLPGSEAAPYLRGVGGAVGTVPIGLHHGYHPAHANAAMLLGGRRARVLRVCLETTILDLADHPSAVPGDRVTVLGDDGEARIEVAELAAWQGTGSQAALSALARGMPRLYFPAAGAPPGQLL